MDGCDKGVLTNNCGRHRHYFAMQDALDVPVDWRFKKCEVLSHDVLNSQKKKHLKSFYIQAFVSHPQNFFCPQFLIE
jgi:hypothetical protein